MASLVLGAAGAALAPSGWAAFGWAVGSSVGSMLFPGGEDQEGPRLNDLQIQDSSYGKPIPIVYGRDRIAGNIIWSKPLEEVKNEESAGKGGGPTSTTYNYFASFALGLCEGEIAGVRRIWINNKLVYKYTDDATVEELLVSNATIDGITVYTGTETQDPDPLIQAHKGAANTPAFRGLAYLVFDRLDVGNSGRIPNITVEVVGAGTEARRGYIDTSTIDRVYHGEFFYELGPIAYYADGVVDSYSSKSTSDYVASSGVPYLQNEYMERYTVSGERVEALNFSNADEGGEGLQERLYALEKGLIYRNYGYGNGEPILAGMLDGNPAFITLTTINEPQLIGSPSPSTGHLLPWGSISISSDAVTGSVGDLGQALVDYGDTGKYLHCAVCSQDESYMIVLVGTSKTGISAWRKITASSTVTDAGTLSITTTVCPAKGMGRIVGATTGAASIDNKSGKLWVTRVASGTARATAIDLSVEPATYNSYDSGVAFGSSPSVIAHDGVALVFHGDKLSRFSDDPIIAASDVDLSDIVTDICEKAGLSASDIDVTDLTDTVSGYTISRVTSARKAIEPLMMAYFFDGAEFNNKLNFIKRGGSTVLTIPENDLGVDSEDLYKHTRRQEAELPSEVILDYKDKARDYQTGSQRSRRINTHVTNVAQVSAPIVMSGNKAKRIAEIHHYNSWVEREGFTLQVTQEYIDLNPTDVIKFTAEGDTRKARIVDISYGPTMTLELAAESGNYESDAVAGESESVDQTLGLIGPTNLQLLDIPLLRNQDNDTAIYAAASGYFNGWSGCRVFKSSDDVSYQEVDNLFETITQGYTTTTLADANHTTWDRTSSVTVNWTAGTAPASITESNALTGARYFLIGDEIVVPVNETDNGDGTYTYDTFLRGRRGTDWATSEHETGERVILLDEAKMSRLAMVLSTARYFKGVSIGNYLANAESETFTNTGVSLKPFSPTFIQGTRDGSNNLTITWINRSRYIGGALMPLPLFEDSESYKVEILDAPGGSVIRTLSPNPTTTTDTYSAADQTSDGLTLGDPVTVRISQYSATVGYGYTKEATV